MEVDSITVVISTRMDEDEATKLAKHIKNTCGCDAYVYVIINKVGASLTKLYHDALNMKAETSDIFVFVHDDVEFLKDGWGKEILRLFDEHKDYGIIGVARKCSIR